MKRLQILISNDDGYTSNGLKALVEVAREFGDVVVIASLEPQSGQSHAITVKTPLRMKKKVEEEGYCLYVTNGTPADCVKLALDQIFDEPPNLILSGINHGSNASVSVIYSGTMSVAIEGCLNRIPSVGFSVDEFSQCVALEIPKKYLRCIIQTVIKNGLDDGVCLNVNIPVKDPDNIKGIMVCRQTDGAWIEEFDKRVDPNSKEYYWLTGYLKNYEPDATDTDEWAMENNYVAIVPVSVDMTNYPFLDKMKNWKYEI